MLYSSDAIGSSLLEKIHANELLCNMHSVGVYVRDGSDSEKAQERKPVSLGEIDAIINRTLVYGTLTVLLALLYFGLVIGLESLVHLITGQVSQSSIIIVASTLVIAALFQPLRQRIQRVIDRRFYRRRYDAVKTMEAFRATLRNEVDLNQLRENLLAVVQDTMQPTHVSLWLRTTGPSQRQSTQQLAHIEEEERQAL